MFLNESKLKFNQQKEYNDIKNIYTKLQSCFRDPLNNTERSLSCLPDLMINKTLLQKTILVTSHGKIKKICYWLAGFFLSR